MPSHVRSITFVRHAQSLSNAGGVTMEHGAIPLTERGHRQAQRLAELLPPQPPLVCISPFERTRDTARPYLQRTGAPSRTVHALHEFESFDARLLQGLDGAGRRPVVDDYWRRGEPLQRMGESAETFAEFADRVAAFRRAEMPLLPHGTVVFGHGIWIAMLCWTALGFATADGQAMRGFRAFQLGLPLPNGAVYHFDETTPGQWRVRADDALMRQVDADL